MKLKPIFSASLFAAVTLLSPGVGAASDTSVEAKVPAADAKTEKVAAKKKVKQHSHMEEKTGVPQKAPEADPDKSSAATDKTKHFHPRDGK